MSQPGGDFHFEISVIPMLGHPLYTCEYSHVARAWHLWKFCQCKGGHIKANVKWQRWGYDWYRKKERKKERKKDHLFSKAQRINNRMV
jgi:hypothetical protein